MKTVVIPCAGTGSRLGDLTKNYNKAMCTLGPKPVISYIIEHFTKEDEIIILLGYKGNFLKQVIQACYPDWNISFVEVDKFEGEGSGLGYSLSCAISKLQKPFLFWPNDTLVDNDFSNIPTDHNWVMTGRTEQDSNSYRHVLVNSNSGITILPKNATGYQNSYPYIGICFIHDYQDFWKMFFTNRELFIQDGEVVGINNLRNVSEYQAVNWVDTGNREIFERIKKEYSDKMEETILEKPNEAIWFIDDKVIKFHIDKKFISDRVKRFNTFLSNEQKKHGIKIPKLLSYSENTYTYKREEGVIASKVIDPVLFKTLLKNFFWQETAVLSEEEKVRIYYEFYGEKTYHRITDYLLNSTIEDNSEAKNTPIYINGMKCDSATSILDQINWEYISKLGLFTENYHGDFHLENILIKDDKFIMLDWRQNFGDSKYGDIYYDLAKMYHSLIVNHNMVRDNRFIFKKISKDDYLIDIDRTFLDTECERVLFNFVDELKFNKDLMKLLTALIFLNIAACHIKPYSDFLFYLGKYLINIFYSEYKNTKFFNQV